MHDRQANNSTGCSRKDDQGKAPLDLIPGDVLFALARVLAFGRDRYGAYNWCRTGFDWSRLFAAAQRHLWSFWQGENTDPESGLSHLHHALCCVVFLAAHELRGLGQDDRQSSAEPQLTLKKQELAR